MKYHDTTRTDIVVSHKLAKKPFLIR